MPSRLPQAAIKHLVGRLDALVAREALDDGRDRRDPLEAAEGTQQVLGEGGASGAVEGTRCVDGVLGTLRRVELVAQLADEHLPGSEGPGSGEGEDSG